ncbi:hypothetical protein H5410_034783 [Solanum commersonii]|uniref:Uncharacterized protein n=1 Tax=Solanum commersonii TaxID=4109 RepID=A0A9J5YUA3_SOLCO|nr:hypothetical protein H5410_034783 [Solanum commersonii]
MATLIQRTGFLGQNDTSIFWASPKNTGCLFLPYISMVIVEDVSISVATIFSGEIASSLVEEHSSHVDNVEGLPNTFINAFQVTWTICSMRCLQEFSPKKWRKLLLPLVV